MLLDLRGGHQARRLQLRMHVRLPGPAAAAGPIGEVRARAWLQLHLVLDAMHTIMQHTKFIIVLRRKFTWYWIVHSYF
eukprot:SAG31_NODE_1514_length_8042_cov_6.955936_6_plen_78_part_00